MKDGFKKLNSAISATVRETDFNKQKMYFSGLYLISLALNVVIFGKGVNLGLALTGV